MENQTFKTGMKNSCFGVQAGIWGNEPEGNLPAAEVLLHQFFPFIPTEEQKKFFSRLGRFLERKAKTPDVFIFTGFAGTGKTTCLRAVQQTAVRLGFKVLLLAPTGRAAKIISKHTGQKAHTLHRQLYYQKQHPYSGATEFVLRKNFFKNCLFIVDEASMIGCGEDDSDPCLLTDLISYINQTGGNKLLLAGDPAQLPPAGGSLSPALHHEVLQYVYNLPTETFQLQEVLRQQQGSGILENATALRHKLTAPETPFSIRTAGYKDICRMPAEKLEEGLRYAYEKFGMENCLLICPSNQEALHFSQFIRRNILNRTRTIEAGDILMISRNNYHCLPPKRKPDFLANGDFAEVKEVQEEELLGDFKFLNMVIGLPDYPGQASFRAKILLDTLISKETGLSKSRYQELFSLIVQKYGHLSSRSKMYRAIRKDPYLHALQVKYAYALTCHKAQGGQWDAVFVNQGFWQHEPFSPEKIRWFYTAFTRAVKELYLPGLIS